MREGFIKTQKSILLLKKWVQPEKKIEKEKLKRSIKKVSFEGPKGGDANGVLSQELIQQADGG